ncbi:unnamed protein product [Vicia faba]|uniref:DUF4283 domain-containing protein n=1 Tax=Vicia faba TaxID=3906 RepID=A0AAV1ARC2_VICFA|nr:unnamed protein product [Vicia faba]
MSLDVKGEVVVPKAKGTSAKSFAQVLSNTFVIIPHGQFPKSSLKGEDIVMKILEEEYKPGFLKLFTWTPDFNPNNYKQTTIQCWVCFLILPLKYWSPNIIFAIASCLGTPMCLDATTNTTEQGKIDKNQDGDSNSDAQQAMEFLSESWANMDKSDDIVDLDENTSQPFQLVVPRKMKNKKNSPESDKSFKVGACNRTPH